MTVIVRYITTNNEYKIFNDVVSVTDTKNNFLVTLREEDYFGKLVHLFNRSEYFIEICN